MSASHKAASHRELAPTRYVYWFSHFCTAYLCTQHRATQPRCVQCL